MAVHGTILARQRRIRGGTNAIWNGTGWNSAIYNSAIHNGAIHNGAIYNGAIYSGTSCSSPNHNGADWVSTNATRVIPQPAFGWHPLWCRCWPNFD
jgi:hypothetical protein